MFGPAPMVDFLTVLPKHFFTVQGQRGVTVICWFMLIKNSSMVVTHACERGFQVLTCRCHCHTVSKIRFMYSQEWNCAALFPIPTLMYLWAIYIFPGLVCLFGGSKIGRMGIYKCGKVEMWKLRDRKNEATQFHFWEYINLNQTFILNSHRPFICSALVSLTCRCHLWYSLLVSFSHLFLDW